MIMGDYVLDNGNFMSQSAKRQAGAASSDEDPTDAMIAAGALVLANCGLLRGNRWNEVDGAVQELAADVFRAMIRLSDRPDALRTCSPSAFENSSTMSSDQAS